MDQAKLVSLLPEVAQQNNKSSAQINNRVQTTATALVAQPLTTRCFDCKTHVTYLLHILQDTGHSCMQPQPAR